MGDLLASTARMHSGYIADGEGAAGEGGRDGEDELVAGAAKAVVGLLGGHASEGKRRLGF